MSTMIATRAVYPVGYSTLVSQERIEELMSDPETLLIDTRAEKDLYLKNMYGERYRYAGSHLGQNWTEIGIKGLIKYLNEGHDLILLCQCRRYEECHVAEVVRRLSEQIHVDVIHWQPQPTNTIQCLSIKQPWAWLIANGLKSIENRDWQTDYRGPLLIHAGKAVDKDCFVGNEINFDFFEQFGSEVVDAMPRYRQDYILGCIVGQADLTNVVDHSDDPWFCGTYGFVLENARPLEPIPYPGKLKLFDVPKDILQDVLVCVPEGQEEALSVETDAEEVATIAPPDLAPDNNAEDDKASKAHCAVCGELATLFSSSGHPESSYCETHGHCLRCGSSVERFVKHPYITNYVCPCVVGFEMQRQRNEALKQAKPVAFSF